MKIRFGGFNPDISGCKPISSGIYYATVPTTYKKQ